MEFKINTIKVNEADLVMLPVYGENKDLQDEKLTVIYISTLKKAINLKVMLGKYVWLPM